MPLLIGIDNGTTRIKATVVNHRGEVLAAESVEDYETRYPYPGWAEQDPTSWWNATKEVLSRTLNQDEVDPRDVVAIGLTGQMHGPVFLDSDGSPLSPCIIWSDTRADEESTWIKNRVGNIQEITGNSSTSSFTAPKILWFRNHKPSLYDKIWKILLPKDFINFKLTGRAVTDPSDASGTLLYDINNRVWSEEVLEHLEVDYHLLPEIALSTSQSGRINSEIASELGIPEDVGVFVGGGDLATGLIGNGVAGEGRAAITIGTAGQVLIPTPGPRKEFFDNLYLFSRSGQEGCFTLGTVPAGGLSLQWFKDSVTKIENLFDDYPNSVNPFDLLSKQASGVPPGSRGLVFLPFLMGTGNPQLDYKARGVFLGLSPEHGKGEMVRAIMEGVTMALKESLQVTENAGIEVGEIRLGAGATNSQLWNQIQADIYGRSVQLVDINDPSPLGAALLAGVGAEIFPNIKKATDLAVQTVASIEARPEESQRYAEIFNIYKETYRALVKIFPKINRYQD